MADAKTFVTLEVKVPGYPASFEHPRFEIHVREDGTLYLDGFVTWMADHADQKSAKATDGPMARPEPAA